MRVRSWITAGLVAAAIPAMGAATAVAAPHAPAPAAHETHAAPAPENPFAPVGNLIAGGSAFPAGIVGIVGELMAGMDG